jgi:NADPH:quinone reductase
MASLLDKGLLKAVVAKAYPLERASDAHAELEAGGVSGKLVLSVR